MATETAKRPVQVVAGIAVRGDKVLLIRSRRHGVATPGGKMQPGESHEETLRREVREETGLDVVRFGRYLHTDRQLTLHCHLYAMEVSDGGPTPGDDADAAWWGDPREVLESSIPRDYPLILDVLARGVDGDPAPLAIDPRTWAQRADVIAWCQRREKECRATAEKRRAEGRLDATDTWHDRADTWSVVAEGLRGMQDVPPEYAADAF